MSTENSMPFDQFKTVIEYFDSKLKGIAGVMHHNHGKMEADMHSIKQQVGSLVEGQTVLKIGQARLEGDATELKAGQARLEGDTTELKSGQVGLRKDVTELINSQAKLEAGQTEIKQELKRKVSSDEFKGWEKRVHKLENRVA